MKEKKQSQQDITFMGNVLEKVASFFMPTIGDRLFIDVNDNNNNRNHQNSNADEGSGDAVIPPSPSTPIPMRVKKKEEIFESHSFNHRQNDSPSNMLNEGNSSSYSFNESNNSNKNNNNGPSSLPSDTSKYLSEYFSKHSRNIENIDEKRKEILKEEDRTSDNNERNRITTSSEIEEFTDQIREIARDTFHNNNNNSNNDQSESAREQQRLKNYSLVLLTQELEKLTHIENNNSNYNVDDIHLNLLQENQSKTESSSQAMTYGEFMSDLEYIKKQHNWDNNNEGEHNTAQDTYSIIGNAELEMEKETKYPEKILPQDFQQEDKFYKKPEQINQPLFRKVKDRMIRQKL